MSRGPQGGAHTGGSSHWSGVRGPQAAALRLRPRVSVALRVACSHSHTVRGPQGERAHTGCALTLVRRVRGPWGGTLTLVHACPVALRAARSLVQASVALRVARSHWSTTCHGPQGGALTGSAVSAPGEQWGSDPASPWRSSASFQMWSQLFALQLQFSGIFQEKSLACILSSIFLAVIMGYSLHVLLYQISTIYLSSHSEKSTPLHLVLVPQIIPVQELNHLTKHRDALEAVCPAVFSGFSGSQQPAVGESWGGGASPLPHFRFSSPSPSKPSPPRLETQGQRRED